MLEAVEERVTPSADPFNLSSLLDANQLFGGSGAVQAEDSNSGNSETRDDIERGPQGSSPPAAGQVPPDTTGGNGGAPTQAGGNSSDNSQAVREQLVNNGKAHGQIRSFDPEGADAAPTASFSTQAVGDSGGSGGTSELSIDDVSQPEGDAGTSPMTFTVTRTGDTTQTSTVDYITGDGLAEAGSDYQATSGTLTFDPGVTSQTISIGILGDTTVEPDEDFTVLLTNVTNGTIASGSAGIGFGTILNDDAEPLPIVSVDSVSQSEGDSGTSNFTFTVSLSQASSQPVEVLVSTRDGSASSSQGDYQAKSETLTFAPGETSKTFDVVVQGDTEVEPDETFFVDALPTLNPSGGGTGTGTIANDDAESLPTVSVDSVSQSEGDSGTSNFTFTVSLSQASSQPVEVLVSTRDGSASSSQGDYQAKSETLTFAPGETTKTFDVVVNGDTEVEPDETFFVDALPTLNPSGGGTGTGTIVNDDAALPIVSIQDFSASEGDSGSTSFEFDVTLSQASSQDVTITYSTFDASATAGSDYIGVLGGQVVIQAGQTSGVIAVEVLGDADVEPDESFLVSLQGVINATLDPQTSTATGTIVNDDSPPVVSEFHVATTGDDATGDGSAVNPFRTIQRAIDEAFVRSGSDETILVAGGTYDTPGVDLGISVLDDPSLSGLQILGGFDSTFQNRTPKDSVYIPQTAGSNVIQDVDVRAENVTIDGFHWVFDGVQGFGGSRSSAGVFSRNTGLILNNNVIEVGVSVGGQRSAGLQTVFGTNASGLSITNNSFEANAGSPASFSAASHGIFLNPGPQRNSPITISGNTITGSSLASAIVIDTVGGVVIADNILARGGAGSSFFPLISLRARTAGSPFATSPLSNVTIQSNQLDGAGRGAGIQLSDVAGATQAIANVQIGNNTIANTLVGISVGPFSSQSSSITASIDASTLTNNGIGLFLSPLGTGGASTISFTNGTIVGPGALVSGSAGIKALGGNLTISNTQIQDADTGLLGSDFNLTLTGSQLTSNATGVSLQAVTAQMADDEVTDAFDFDGSLELLASSTLDLSGGGSLAGTATVDGVLQFLDGDFDLLAGFLAEGDGEEVIGGKGGKPKLNVPKDGVTKDVNVKLQKGGVIDGPGTLNIKKRFDWTGGSLLNAETRIDSNVEAIMEIDGEDDKTLGGTAKLVNQGVVNWRNGNILLDGAGQKTLNNEGVFSLWSDNNIRPSGDPTMVATSLTINNTNTFAKVGGDFRSLILAVFNNSASGVVDVSEGELWFNSGGSISGRFDVAGGAKVVFTSIVNGATAKYTLTPARGVPAILSGAGTYVIDGETEVVVPNGQVVEAENITMKSAGVRPTLTLLGTLTAHRLSISDGKIVGGGQLEIAAQRTMEVADTRRAVILGEGTTIKVSGRLTVTSSGGIERNDGDINSGTIEISATGSMVVNLPKATDSVLIRPFVTSAGSVRIVQGVATFAARQKQEPDRNTFAGLWATAGTIEVAQQAVLETLSLGGGESVFVHGGTLQLAGGKIDGLVVIGKNGAFDASGTVTGQVFNFGQTTLSGDLVVSSIYRQDSGTTDLQGKLLTPGTVNLNGGELKLSDGEIKTEQFVSIASGALLSGAGKIQALVINDGTIYVGGKGAVGKITITRPQNPPASGPTFRQSAKGKLVMDVDFNGNGSFDQLVISGAPKKKGVIAPEPAAKFAGTLEINAIGQPKMLKDLKKISLITYESKQGDFAPISGLDVGNGFEFKAKAGNTAYTLLLMKAKKK